MNQHTTEMTKSKKDILEGIKKTYRIKPVTAIIVLILTAFMLMLFFGEVNDFVRKLTSNFVDALFPLLFVWILGFGLYEGIWQFFNSRKINKELFPKIEQFISESEEKSYDETETEVNEMVKVAYKDYTVKYNKMKKIYWNFIKLGCVLLLITFVISLFQYRF
jgi:succinate dehydrogenase hydrophobic anchor subunit